MVCGLLFGFHKLCGVVDRLVKQPAHRRPRPRIVTGHAGPPIVVGLLPALVDHAVDAAAPAQHLVEVVVVVCVWGGGTQNVL